MSVVVINNNELSLVSGGECGDYPRMKAFESCAYPEKTGVFCTQILSLDDAFLFVACGKFLSGVHNSGSSLYVCRPGETMNVTCLDKSECFGSVIRVDKCTIPD